MKKSLLTLAAIAAFTAANAQTVTYNYFDPKDCDAEGWLWFNTQEKIDKYVGFAGVNPADDPKILLQSATFENSDMEYDEPFADPTIKGYNAEDVQGGEGSWTGAISLCGGSTTNGSDAPNGGGFMLHLPDLAQFDLKLSSEGKLICLGLSGAAGTVEPVDCGTIQTYLKMGIFLNKPLAATSQYTWTNIQDVKNETIENGFNHLASPAGKPVTALIRNNRKSPLLVQAIRVFTYTKNYDDDTAVEGVEVSEDAPAVYYNLQGVQVKGDQPGIYICRQGNKTSKVVVK